jgi:hypothetical protein
VQKKQKEWHPATKLLRIQGTVSKSFDIFILAGRLPVLLYFEMQRCRNQTLQLMSLIKDDE